MLVVVGLCRPAPAISTWTGCRPSTGRPSRRSRPGSRRSRKRMLGSPSATGGSSTSFASSGRRSTARSPRSWVRTSASSPSRISRWPWPRRKPPRHRLRHAPGPPPARGAISAAAQGAAAPRGGDRAGEHALPLRLRRDGEDRRGPLRASRHRAGAVPGDRDRAAALCLSRLPGRDRPGAGAPVADRGRAADRGRHRACAGRQVRRPCAALSPVPDHAPGRPRSRSLDAGRLDRPRRRSIWRPWSTAWPPI